MPLMRGACNHWSAMNLPPSNLWRKRVQNSSRFAVSRREQTVRRWPMGFAMGYRRLPMLIAKGLSLVAVCLPMSGCDVSRPNDRPPSAAAPAAPPSQPTSPDSGISNSSEVDGVGNPANGVEAPDEPIPIESVKVLKTRLVPFENPNGLRSKTVLVEWKNVGDAPVRALDVDIYLLDRRGRLLEVVESQPVYAVSDDSPGIAPGETYEDGDDEGYITDPTLAPTAFRARVKVKQVVTRGAY